MPLSDEHRRLRGRNYTVAAILVAMMVLFFVVTMVRIAGAS
jgi:hypothetical protein